MWWIHSVCLVGRRIHNTNGSSDDEVGDSGPKNCHQCSSGNGHSRILCKKPPKRLNYWYSTQMCIFCMCKTFQKVFLKLCIFSGNANSVSLKISFPRITFQEQEENQHTFRSPEMLAPARMPVAEGKKMENIPKKLPSGPRQLGTKLAAKRPAVNFEILC